MLAAIRRDWLALLDRDPARAVLDADLVLPTEDTGRLGAALADVATVDRALGGPLEQRGLLPTDGRAVLVVDAAAQAVLSTAQAVLSAAKAVLSAAQAVLSAEPPAL